MILEVFMVKRRGPSGPPVYLKLMEDLRTKILKGELEAGQTIPPERILSEQYGISRVSARKAVKSLIAEGLISSAIGKGNIVNDARDLPKKPKTLNIGYVFYSGDTRASFQSNPYFGHMIAGVDEEAKRHGYHVILSTLNPVTNPSGALPELVIKNKVDGLIVEGISYPDYQELNSVCPAVIISDWIETNPGIIETPLDVVTVDNIGAMDQVGKYLKELGHSKIGFISQDIRQSCFGDRYNGFRLALIHHNLTFYPEWCIFEKTGDIAAKKLLAMKEKPTAVIACNDYFALYAIKELKESGFSVPGDFSIIGFDDIVEAKGTNPPLTTVKVPTETVGRVACSRLIDKINRRPGHAMIIQVETSFIIRDSCSSC
jgi:DNA-binding LacI/PurR family transcriptional regulator